MPPTAAVALWFCIVLLPTFIVHTIFAFAVDSDVRRLKRAGGSLVFTGAFVWAGATLLGGPLVALAYWIIHRSALALSVSPDMEPRIAGPTKLKTASNGS